MWNTAHNYSYTSSYLMKNYPEASEWLLRNIEPTEKIIVPFINVFESIEPNLKEYLVEYSEVWQYANVFLKADNSLEDILEVRNALIDVINFANIKYIVVNSNDPYCSRLFDGEYNDNLRLHLTKVKVFHTPDSAWNDPLNIYRFNPFVEERLNFVSIAGFSEYRTNGVVQLNFNSVGIEIDFENESRIYLPVFLNSSDFESMILLVNVVNLSSTVQGSLVLYFDKDGDEKWGGWNVDYGITIPFKEPDSQSEMWMYESFAEIEYNLLQIGIILDSSTPEHFTIKRISLFETKT